MNFKKLHTLHLCVAFCMFLALSACSKDQTIKTEASTSKDKDFQSERTESQSKIYVQVLSINADEEDGQGMYAFCDIWGEGFERDSFRAHFEFTSTAGVVNNAIKEEAIIHLATDENIQANASDIIIFGGAQ